MNDEIRDAWWQKAMKDFYTVKDNQKELVVLVNQLLNEVASLRFQLSGLVKRVEILEKELEDQVVIL